MRVELAPGGVPRGRIRVPGDKSIAHRALLLAAIAEGPSRLAGLPDAADVRSTAHVLGCLGVQVTTAPEPDGCFAATVRGAGLRGLEAPATALDCGNSGTTMRLLAGLLAGQSFASTLTGDASLRRRPMERIAEPLRVMGAEVLDRQGCAPLSIQGGHLRGVQYRPPVRSAQVKSCVLLAGLYADGQTCVLEEVATRDHTERLLDALGAEVLAAPGRVCVTSGASPSALQGRVPGDASSAAYWLVAATVAPGADLTLVGVGTNPTRDALVRLLRDWGADLRVETTGTWCGEPIGDVTARGGAPLSGGSIAPSEVPGLIDELPLLGLLGPLTRDGVEVRGASELRVKESDRIATTCAAARALGATVDEYPDGFAVRGGTGLRGGVVDAAGDHRIALAAAAVAAAATGPVSIEGAEAAAVSYPGFFHELERCCT